jgi:hypothetical protein
MPSELLLPAHLVEDISYILLSIHTTNNRGREINLMLQVSLYNASNKEFAYKEPSE